LLPEVEETNAVDAAGAVKKRGERIEDGSD
jgi:hypothetical protein